MKQAAILYALSNIGPRLARAYAHLDFPGLGCGRGAGFDGLGGNRLAVLGLGQVPTLAETGRQAAGTAMEKVEQVAPDLKGQLTPLLGSVGLSLPEIAGEAPAADVSGSDLPGVARYPGSVRTYFAREAGRTELRYMGQGEVRAVLDHYVSQLGAAGCAQEVLSATPEMERHRFVNTGDVLDFEIRKTDLDGKVEVTLVNNVI